MPLTSALLVSLVLSAGPDRVLVCRPAVAGDPAAARPEAVAEAVRSLPGQLLDYGVPCESLGEAARAAGRAGLGHGVLAVAEGREDGAHYLLVLTSAPEAEETGWRSLAVRPGDDAAGPLRRALKELEGTIPRPPPRWPTVAGWALVGVGVAVLAAGAVFSARARDEARAAAAAQGPAEWQAAHDAWAAERRRGVAAFAAGGAALAAGLALELAF
jgi:hypothetical protein